MDYQLRDGIATGPIRSVRDAGVSVEFVVLPAGGRPRRVSVPVAGDYMLAASVRSTIIGDTGEQFGASRRMGGGLRHHWDVLWDALGSLGVAVEVLSHDEAVKLARETHNHWHTEKEHA